MRLWCKEDRGQWDRRVEVNGIRRVDINGIRRVEVNGTEGLRSMGQKGWRNIWVVYRVGGADCDLTVQKIILCVQQGGLLCNVCVTAMDSQEQPWTNACAACNVRNK